ncbi:uncharacterized protein A1O5_06088 [Cladophialophora psammophila CBS 110553]|uniref:Cytochrome P450 oxidoreductase n=1 Tax=Cladophialophora psammophila CBS 110553 TaxID=1182543 RepID=W9X197_9EURO|nr:uncharacterized protein A1O5_06088 [Cladophialophora psammophila CBS 110553]EXJ71095.1 hypothetical protein A1O5_06088 [Cladophialophora psammophila CBS 110553]
MSPDSVVGPLLGNVLQIPRFHFLLVLLLLLVARGLYKRYNSPLSTWPGPLLASCSRVWKFWVTYKGHSEHDYMDLHRKYGPIVRTGPNELSFASPEAAKDIFAVGKGVEKTDFYWVFPPAENPDVFTEIREWKHAQLKRFTVQPYSLASLQKMSSSIDAIEKELMDRLDGFANAGQRRCNLGDYLHYFAFDVLGEVAFSHRYGFVGTGTDVEGCIKYIDDVQFYDGLVGQIPWLHYLLRLNPLAIGKKMDNNGKSSTGRDDLLAQFIQGHLRAPDKFTEADVFSVAHGAIGAGSDSTASTMQSFFYLLLNSPSTYQALLSELDAATTSGTLSDPVSYLEAQALPYFQACLHESMRLRPAVGLNIYRKVPPEGMQIDGTFYPGGTEVAVNGWVLHRDKTVFGPDAEDYRPERWLESNAKEMHRHMYQFGGGSHLCLGRNLALLEMNKLLPRLLRRYHFGLVHPGRPLKHRTTFFVVQEGLEVYISLRT